MAIQIICDVNKAEQIKKAIEKEHSTAHLEAEDTKDSERTILIYYTPLNNNMNILLTAMQNGAGIAGELL